MNIKIENDGLHLAGQLHYYSGHCNGNSFYASYDTYDNGVIVGFHGHAEVVGDKPAMRAEIRKRIKALYTVVKI